MKRRDEILLEKNEQARGGNGTDQWRGRFVLERDLTDLQRCRGSRSGLDE